MAPIAESPTAITQAPARANWAVAATSFFFILLQSFCTFAMAVSGFRLILGAGALAGAFGLIHPFVYLHANIYRVPMMVVALGGSVLNLYFIWRIRSLRARPASQWRVVAPTVEQVKSENLQIALSVATLVLLVLEEIGHMMYHGL